LSGADTRRRLLDAAARVIRRDGAGALTLDAVAAQAGVSKGGLLYHFATKDALVEALVGDWLDRFEADVESRAGDRGWPRAYAEVCESAPRSPGQRATDVALLAALTGDPGRLEGVRGRYAAWQERIVADGGDPAVATVIRLAADGLWLADLLGLAPPRGRLRHDVIARLADLSGR
jgi:AcrR family transcriptional regulator